MITEPITLYKLMILYLLKTVNYPLTNNQLSGFFLDYEYTTYFTLQQAISELDDAGFIKTHQSKKSTRYEITQEGSNTVDLFGNDISSGAIKDMDDFLKENKIKLRQESSNFTDYYATEGGDYIVHAEVREENSILYALDINVPDKESAERMCVRWSEKNQEIYAFIVKQLLS
ncbi:protein of unknown function [Oribacterium sp. KHPX15]|uniref:DUF4364 family protein n=1 Tax=Oribacterium sp. KHPX15 TaxID=1855342 RepID=UPI00089B0C1D|nr:DUF4364 family protein [Oribacterium sp. KHPX15]SEA32728.1 protein of unknown function [Oribacterium sp. KHPX15]